MTTPIFNFTAMGENSFQLALKAIDGGNRDEFCSIISKTASVDVTDKQILNLVIRARQRGWNDASYEVLLRYSGRQFAPAVPIYFEWAFQERLRGNHRKAAELLADVVEKPDAGFRTRLSLAHMLHAAGDHVSAKACAELITPLSIDQRLLKLVMSEFDRYIEEFTLDRALKMLDEIVARYPRIDYRKTAELIMSAIHRTTSFSIIRLGDGEGAFAQLSPEDESLYENLYISNRANRMGVWFGSDFDWRGSGFFDETSTLLQKIDECDVVAIPDEVRIRNAYKISSITGVPSLVNILRWSLHSAEPKQLVSSLSIVNDLYITGNLDRVIQAASRVILISCHVSLAEAIRIKYGLSDVRFIKIPGEHGSKSKLGDEVSYGTHFPSVYSKVQSELGKACSGELYLIAGGFLGKLYARTIKRSGGIAIDIGSLADR